MARIPVSFGKLENEYPEKVNYPTADLLAAIGGQVRYDLKKEDDDKLNTCCIRLSWAFDRGGIPIQNIGHGVYYLKGAPRVQPGTERWVKPPILNELYILRVADFDKYLTVKYGEPQLIYDGNKEPAKLVGLSGPTQGIIAFRWNGRPRDFGATGHVDLFRVVPNKDKPPTMRVVCTEECYWMGPNMKAFLWDTKP